ncbi:MAG: helix-hairpin-helix domain-containing protein [Gemmatimonadales bacterium]
MSRLTALPASLFLSALVVALAACSTDSNKAADTAAVAAVPAATVDTMALNADTGMTAPAAAPSAAGKSTSDTATIVPVNINTATDAEILKIPGVGPRMLHEFKEYRPWTSIAQFRREIGKYVDKAEVARFEKYIVIK